MNKIPKKFKIPLMMSIMLPTMILGLPAIMTYRLLPDGADFLSNWINAVGQSAPLALGMALSVGFLANLFITKVLLESESEN
jgi:hypothetical protein